MERMLQDGVEPLDEQRQCDHQIPTEVIVTPDPPDDGEQAHGDDRRTGTNSIRHFHERVHAGPLNPGNGSGDSRIERSGLMRHHVFRDFSKEADHDQAEKHQPEFLHRVVSGQPPGDRADDPRPVTSQNEKEDPAGNSADHEQTGAADQALQKMPALAEKVSDDSDDRSPDHRSGRVVEQKRRPGNSAHPGKDGGDDSDAGDKACEEDRARAMLVKVGVDSVETRRRQRDVLPVSFGKGPPAAPADPVAEVVAEDRGDDRARDDDAQAKNICFREKAGRKEDRLARDRDADVFQKNSCEQRDIAEPAKKTDEPQRHTPEHCASGARLVLAGVIRAVLHRSKFMAPREFRLALLVALLPLLVSCGKSEAEQEAAAREAATPVRVQHDGSIRLSAADRHALNLEVAPVSAGVLGAGILRFGKVQTAVSDEVIVAAPVSGRLTGTSLVAGTAVNAGTTLASIAPSFDASERVTLSVQAADIDGQIAQLEKEIHAKDAEAARTRQLARERIVSVARQQNAAADAAAAHAKLDALRREREVQRMNTVQVAAVRAPISGTLAEVHATAGSVVHQGDVLARIVRPGERFIDLPVGGNEPPGDAYAVLAAGVWLPARLVSRGAAIDEDGFRHDRVAVQGAAATTLLPGSTISVRISRGASTGIIVPDSAIIPTSHGDLVYVQRTPDTFQSRVVHVAERADAFVRVDQGLAPGDVIVVRGVMGLYGESVRSALE